LANLASLRRLLLASLIAGIAAFLAIAVQSWPRFFFGEGRELTGVDVEFEEVCHFPLEWRREGPTATVYRVPAVTATALNFNRQSLQNYPMWNGLVFDGYRRVPWTTLDELRHGPHQILAERLFDGDAAVTAVDEIESLADARDFGNALGRQDGVLISAWYTGSNGFLTNYFVYVLDLKRCLLVKLTLTT
jgi:hypothetical protein